MADYCTEDSGSRRSVSADQGFVKLQNYCGSRIGRWGSDARRLARVGFTVKLAVRHNELSWLTLAGRTYLLMGDLPPKHLLQQPFHRLLCRD